MYPLKVNMGSIKYEFEDYLLTIYELQDSFGMARLSEIGRILNITPGAVNDEIKRMEKIKIVERIPRKGIVLTEKGFEISRDIVRRHRIAEAYLFYFLDVPWEECHRLSHDFEHVIKDEIEIYILKKINDVRSCPHGNRFSIENIGSGMKLLGAEESKKYIIDRITYEERDTLYKFKSMGILPGKIVEIVQRNEDYSIIKTEKGKYPIDSRDMEVIRVVSMDE